MKKDQSLLYLFIGNYYLSGIEQWMVQQTKVEGISYDKGQS